MAISLGFKRTQLGSILVDMKILSQEALDECLIEQKLSGGQERIGALLLRRGLITAAEYVHALSRQRSLVLVTR